MLADLAAHADEQDGTAIRVELGQQELASLVGIALNTAQGALGSLSAAGLIGRGYRAIVITDLVRLREFAESERDNPNSGMAPRSTRRPPSGTGGR